MLPAQPNQSLIDGLQVLQAVSAAGQGVGSRPLGRMLGMEPTRVNRLLKTLAGIGVLEQGGDRFYRPGPGLHVLAATALFGSHLIASAVTPLEALRRRLPQYTVAIGVRWQKQVAYLLHVAPGRPLAEGIGRAGLYPAERSSIGRVLLAATDDAAIKALYGAQTRLIQREMQRVRREGYAWVGNPGEATLAVPIGPLKSATAAVAVSGQITARQATQLVPRLQQTALEIAVGGGRS